MTQAWPTRDSGIHHTLSMRGRHVVTRGTCPTAVAPTLLKRVPHILSHRWHVAHACLSFASCVDHLRFMCGSSIEHGYFPCASDVVQGCLTCGSAMVQLWLTHGSDVIQAWLTHDSGFHGTLSMCGRHVVTRGTCRTLVVPTLLTRGPHILCHGGHVAHACLSCVS